MPRKSPAAKAHKAEQQRMRRAARKRAGLASDSGKHYSLFQTGQFCAWDGEGTYDNEHSRYILLCNSQGEHRYNPQGLSTQQCLDFLVETAAASKRAIHVGFGFSYDANMILADVPYDTLSLLHARGKVGKSTTIRLDDYWYRIRYMPRKRLSVARITYSEKWSAFEKTRFRITIYDVLGFFQTSFVHALEQWMPTTNKEAIATIERMKAQRSMFHVEQIDEIREYCLSECTLLAELCDELREALKTADITINRWDGAGAIAAALLQKHGAKEYLSTPPPHVHYAAQCAYAGGRIEALHIGHANQTCYDYDVRSAYPSAMAVLPDLRGEWLHSSYPQFDSSVFGLWHVRFSFPTRLWYPLFYRCPDGTILFPQTGEGWYHTCEISSALLYMQVHGGMVELLEAYQLESLTDCRPFSWIDDVYTQRAIWRAQGNPAEKVLKLGLNSLYGKMAQQVGGTPERLPPFFSIIAAGYITAYTRAKLVGASVTSIDNVIAFATDGIFTHERLWVPLGRELGQWEESSVDDMISVQPGFYATLYDGSWHVWSRGLEKPSQADDNRRFVESILSAWQNKAPVIPQMTRRFVTLGAALASRERFRTWRAWLPVERQIDITGLNAKHAPIDYRHARPHIRFEHLPACINEYDCCSTPYPIAWIDSSSLAQFVIEQNEDMRDSWEQITW